MIVMIIIIKSLKGFSEWWSSINISIFFYIGGSIDIAIS